MSGDIVIHQSIVGTYNFSHRVEYSITNIFRVSHISEFMPWVLMQMKRNEKLLVIVRSKLVITGSLLTQKYLSWQHIEWWEYIEKTAMAFYEKLYIKSLGNWKFVRFRQGMLVFNHTGWSTINIKWIRILVT